MLFYNDVFAVRGKSTQEDWIERSCQELRSQLAVWEARQAKSNPGHKATKVQHIDEKVIGTPFDRKLNVKAAETKTFLLSGINY